MKEIKKGKKRREKEKEGLDKLSFCFQRTNWCSLRGCFETEKSRWETFRGEPDPIELWLVAGVVEERKKKKEKRGKRASSYPPFFPPVFLSLSGSKRRSTSVWEFAKSSPLQASETIVSFRGWAGFMEVAARNFRNTPGKSCFS